MVSLVVSLVSTLELEVSTMEWRLIHCVPAAKEPGGQGAVFGNGQPACL